MCRVRQSVCRASTLCSAPFISLSAERLLCVPLRSSVCVQSVYSVFRSVHQSECRATNLCSAPFITQKNDLTSSLAVQQLLIIIFQCHVCTTGLVVPNLTYRVCTAWKQEHCTSGCTEGRQFLPDLPENSRYTTFNGCFHMLHASFFTA